MAVDSRAKGARGEYLVRDLLRESSGLQFERVPASGALAYLKGDLFVPHEINRFCIEVKNYEESPLTDKIFTNKSNYVVKWWEKLLEQAIHMKQEPLLIFKYNRSKTFVVTELEPESTEKYWYISWLNCYVMLLEEWLKEEEIVWLNLSKNK
jgi:Holliday junction resolvase